MPDLTRRTVLASTVAPLAAYLPWPAAEQWEFRWSLLFKPSVSSVQLNCLACFPDGYTREFRKTIMVSGCMRAVMGEANAVNEGLRYQVYVRAIEVKRDIFHVWWQRKGNTVVDSRYREEMDAFSEDLSDVDLPGWLSHA